MAVAEKLPGTELSIAATVIGLIIGGAVFFAGKKKPEVWVAQMTVSHHASYGSFGCQYCHRSDSFKAFGYGTTITCSTSECHQEFSGMYGIEVEPTIEKMLTLDYGDKTWKPDTARHHLELHKAAEKMGNCMTCHKEHSNDPAPFPPGFDRLPAGPNVRTAWTSLKTGGPIEG